MEIKFNYEEKRRIAQLGDILYTTCNRALLVVKDEDYYVIIDLSKNEVIDCWDDLDWLYEGTTINGEYNILQIIPSENCELIVK